MASDAKETRNEGGVKREKGNSGTSGDNKQKTKRCPAGSRSCCDDYLVDRVVAGLVGSRRTLFSMSGRAKKKKKKERDN